MEALGEREVLRRVRGAQGSIGGARGGRGGQGGVDLRAAQATMEGTPALTMAQAGQGGQGSVRDRGAPGRAHRLHMPSHRPRGGRIVLACPI